MSNNVTCPQTFFGFRLGDDYKMARWDSITEYFYRLNEQSENIRVINLGPTTENNPFLLAIISSANNLSNLEELQEVNAQITDPRGLSEAAINSLVNKGRVIVCQSMGLHANEIAATQMAPQLAYDLITNDDETTKNILENVIFLMIPCFNPDGQIMVTDWYNEHRETPYEGCDLPWLYHKYCGHDNNRDGFMLNLVESKYMGKILFEEWHPQVFQDHHEMGGYQPRLFVCPYCEPIHPHADPLIWREINWYGAHMIYKLEEEGKQGVISGAMFPAWYHMGFHWLGNYHNIASLLTETAQAKLASPLYVHPHQLRPLREDGSVLHNFPHYKPQTNFPNPWPGGWWRLRDMVNQQLIAATGIMDIAARCRETVLRNAVHKALNQTNRGKEDDSGGFFIRPDQHDPLTVTRLINILGRQGIEIQRLQTEATINNKIYPQGTYFITCAQPKRGAVKTLLEQTFWPDDAWARRPDGSPTSPFDTVTDTLAEMMGVTAEPTEISHKDLMEEELNFKQISTPIAIEGKIKGNRGKTIVLDSRENSAFRTVNKILNKGSSVSRALNPLSVEENNLQSGCFIINKGDSDQAEKIVQTTGTTAYWIDEVASTDGIYQPRIAMYQRFWGGNMAEGWTRMTLENFDFSYKTVRDNDICGDLNKLYDVFILPDDTMDKMAGTDKEIEDRLKVMPQPEKYCSRLGETEIGVIRNFVENGGTLVAVNRASQLAIEAFGLQISNVAASLPNKLFYCPGSMLRIRINNTNPLGFGMPNQALIMHYNSPVFSINPSYYNDRYEAIATYPKENILESGWLIGEEYIAGKPAMLNIKCGKGQIVLYGFQVNFRNQTHGTFKLLFNALYRVNQGG